MIYVSGPKLAEKFNGGLHFSLQSVFQDKIPFSICLDPEEKVSHFLVSNSMNELPESNIDATTLFFGSTLVQKHFETGHMSFFPFTKYFDLFSLFFSFCQLISGISFCLLLLLIRYKPDFFLNSGIQLIYLKTVGL